MMQTFVDEYTNIKQEEGRIGLMFWLSAVADEIKNIAEQDSVPFREGNHFLRVTTFKSAVSALLFLPLFAIFFTSLVRFSLALPHPPLSGVGVLIVLAILVLLAGVLSVMAGYWFACALVRVLQNAKHGWVKAS